MIFVWVYLIILQKQGDFFYWLHEEKNKVGENADILVYFELVTTHIYLAMFSTGHP